jgi:hypothetical protein
MLDWLENLLQMNWQSMCLLLVVYVTGIMMGYCFRKSREPLIKARLAKIEDNLRNCGFKL